MKQDLDDRVRELEQLESWRDLDGKIAAVLFVLFALAYLFGFIK